MIDVHSHILPGLDDGPTSMDETIQMCKIALDDGITKIVATPHTGDGFYKNDSARIISAVKELNQRISQEGLNLEIIPGADVHISYNLIQKIEKGEILTINNNGRYIILEIPQEFVPNHITELIFKLRVIGITPIISHPERNFKIQHYIDLVESFVHFGAVIQITAASVTGEFGDSVQRCAFSLLKRDLVHLLATDAHSTDGRKPLLSFAVEIAKKIIGEKKAWALVTTIPESIIKGRAL